ncbi:TspO/MBR family protein [Novosphingobium sp. FKTRR1]|uniref:TspO/MBR family protein n=1 Tax=unclassified Novosphingobium TaxID=2644732 RepID=UPI001CF0B7CD|nr:TspO/MBR family protein [Novosphingobium sp. FKTRR1]
MQQIASPAQLRASIIRWSLFTVPSCLGLGFLSGRAAGSVPDNPWFAALVKPALYPPPLAFPIVWSILYVMMGLALALVCSARGARGQGLAVTAFVVQLLVNLAWSPAFFMMHQISLALGLIVALAVALLVTTVLFWRVRRVAGMLLLPYLAWVCFASSLNLQILQLNPQADGASGSGATVRVEL